MIRNWNDVKWFFEPDGFLRDIYVQEVTIADWEKLIDLLNSNYVVLSGENEDQQINKGHVIKYLMDKTGELNSIVQEIDLNGISIRCYFFLLDQIEFDIDPKEIKSIQDFETIEKFMVSVSKILKNQVTLTMESLPEFPLIKIDFDKGINKVLTEKEAKELIRKKNSLLTKLKSIKTNLMMLFFPKSFKNTALKSANDAYRSTEKNKNMW